MFDKKNLKNLEHIIENCSAQLQAIKSGYCPECSCICDDQYYCLTCSEIETNQDCEINAYNSLKYMLSGNNGEEEFFENIDNFQVIYVDNDIDINFLINNNNKDIFFKCNDYTEIPIIFLFDYIKNVSIN